MIQIHGTIIGTIKDVGDGFYLAKFYDEQSKNQWLVRGLGFDKTHNELKNLISNHFCIMHDREVDLNFTIKEHDKENNKYIVEYMEI